jgi:hypothetical protein
MDVNDRIKILEDGVEALKAPEYLAELLVSRLAADGFGAAVLTQAQELLAAIRAASG